MDRYIGKILDQRYKIEQLIGVGGMANVYKAYDEVQDRIVAIKILKDEYVDNEDFLRRFKNESKAIAALSHPNIVKIFDVSFNDDFYWIAMEFIDGITLKEYIEQQGILKWRESSHFVIQILLALQHAHNKGIVHRDMKPQNIMLLRNGTIKIMDFGIARFARSEAKTLTDRAIGSVHYISPEQARGATISQNTDIYSVGVILFEMVTGCVPFQADSAVSVAIKQIESNPKKPRQLNSSIPKGLEQIIMKAMMKDSSERYQNATQMLKDLATLESDPNTMFNYDNGSDKNKLRQMNNMIKEYPNHKVNTVLRRKFKDMSNDEGGRKGKKHINAIQSLTGIAMALVVVVIFFVVTAYIVYNPFAPIKNIEVPNLVGKLYQEVKKEGQYKNFDIQQETTSYNEEYDEGYIFEQSPSSGRIVKNKAIIRVKVSKGRKTISVPDFSNKEYSAVSIQIQKLGLKVSPVKMFDPKVTENYVIKTNPAKDSEVPIGTKITVYVSMGMEDKIVTVPNLVGIETDTAKRIIEEKGLKQGSISPVPSDKPEGIIVAQDPEEKSQVSMNTYVNLNVSNGNKPTNKVTMAIALPKITRIVPVQALLDGKEIIKENIEPAEVGNWKLEVEGEKRGKVKVFIDGKMYTEIEVDFVNRTFKELSNKRSDFEKEIPSSSDGNTLSTSGTS